MRVVVMGVSGCGKTTVGQAAAAAVQAMFFDGDDLHPHTNIEKMSRGEPLTDADRAPWLVRVGQALAAEAGDVVIGCSALKHAYRDIIRAKAGAVHFVHLHAPKEVLERRVNEREGHFMPPALLDSQFAVLEHLDPTEDGVVVNIDQPFEGVVAETTAYMRSVLS
ncbi:MAG: gluconokinase [Pseudomonadota bacterium]